MTQYLASPRLVHLEGLYHVFKYIRNQDMSRVVFDKFQPKFDENAFVLETMERKEFYGDIEEEIPPRISDPLGKSVHTTCFVNANHAGNVVTLIFQTGVLVYAINAPIV